DQTGALPATAQEVVAGLVLPAPQRAASRTARPLPVADLHRLPRGCPILYDINRVDRSGRVASNNMISALGWKQGHKFEFTIVRRAIVLRASTDGPFSVPQRPCIVLPRAARRFCGIRPGDQVLLAAAPQYGIVIVHTLPVLDDMLAGYYAAHTAGGMLWEPHPPRASSRRSLTWRRHVCCLRRWA
ncbi:MAG: hypothetical protein ACRDNF_08595, partial [Streptosporangiaceae bacterium]